GGTSHAQPASDPPDRWARAVTISSLTSPSGHGNLGHDELGLGPVPPGEAPPHAQPPIDPTAPAGPVPAGSPRSHGPPVTKGQHALRTSRTGPPPLRSAGEHPRG